MDVTVNNDYTIDSMLRGCDEVIDTIIKQFGTQEVDKKIFRRKTGSDLVEELGATRIEEGASRVEICELFKPQLVECFEKEER